VDVRWVRAVRTESTMPENEVVKSLSQIPKISMLGARQFSLVVIEDVRGEEVCQFVGGERAKELKDSLAA